MAQEARSCASSAARRTRKARIRGESFRWAVNWTSYASREDRDRVNASAMKDSRVAGMDPKSMPFDGKRMFWGGFKRLFAM